MRGASAHAAAALSSSLVGPPSGGVPRPDRLAARPYGTIPADSRSAKVRGQALPFIEHPSTSLARWERRDTVGNRQRPTAHPRTRGAGSGRAPRRGSRGAARTRAAWRFLDATRARAPAFRGRRAACRAAERSRGVSSTWEDLDCGSKSRTASEPVGADAAQDDGHGGRDDRAADDGARPAIRGRAFRRPRCASLEFRLVYDFQSTGRKGPHRLSSGAWCDRTLAAKQKTWARDTHSPTRLSVARPSLLPLARRFMESLPRPIGAEARIQSASTTIRRDSQTSPVLLPYPPGGAL